MADILFLPHRLPYPPNKGDKVRSYHLLKYLAARHRVFLGTFMDDPDDARYIPEVQALCAEAHVVPLNPQRARLGSLTGLLTGEALTLPYYRARSMQTWVDEVIKRQGIRTAVVFSSAMAQYVESSDLRLLVDFVDVDSDKWTQYAAKKSWPMSWVYRREGQRLLDFEHRIAKKALASFFVTDAEVALFQALIGDRRLNVTAISNGVDADFFAPTDTFQPPYERGEIPVVFTGAMDYWPNVDAVTWFASEALPALLARNPAIRFYIVGMRPTPAVQALAGPRIVVTGTVPDVRPYLQGAAVVVAPLRIARGIQNKVLEAMAMARPVVVTDTCAAPIAADPGVHLDTARDGTEFVERVLALLNQPERAAAMAAAARECVVTRYSWQAHLDSLGRYLEVAAQDTSAKMG